MRKPSLTVQITPLLGLLKKHAALQAELAGRLSNIKAVQTTAAGLLSSHHYASDSIQQRLTALLTQWEALHTAITVRNTGLHAALLTHQFFTDTNEAEAWMAEKQPVVLNDDYGKDEDSAQVRFFSMLVCFYFIFERRRHC